MTVFCGLALAGTAAGSSAARPTANGEALAFQPVLRLGTHGPLVADWQRVLNEWMRSVAASPHPTRADVQLRDRLGGRLAVDGIFGQATEVATKQWQRDAHVRATAVVTWRTWLTWIGAGVTCCGAGYPNFTGRFDGKPDPAVGWWQVALDRWLHLHGKPTILITGRYTPERGQ